MRGELGVLTTHEADVRMRRPVVAWLLIAAGSAGFGLWACDGDPPAGPSSAVTLGDITVAPTGAGLAGATRFTFTAVGFNSSDGAPLTYAWVFGDGTTGTGGPAITHIYAAAGTWDVVVTVSNRSGTSVTARLSRLRTASLAVNWYLRDAAGQPFMTWTSLTMNGLVVSGVQDADGCRYAVSGEVTLPRSLRLVFTRGQGDPACWPDRPVMLVFTGTADESFDSFSGAVDPGGAATLLRCRDLHTCP